MFFSDLCKEFPNLSCSLEKRFLTACGKILGDVYIGIRCF